VVLWHVWLVSFLRLQMVAVMACWCSRSMHLTGVLGKKVVGVKCGIM
jgi:hypothetical protein